MALVYIWNYCLGGSTLYAPASRVTTTTRWDGAAGQKVEQQQRSSVTLSGEVVRDGAPDFDIMIDRLRGGINLVGLWDMELRAQFGWGAKLAINSAGAEFWRADGQTNAYAGEAANPPTGPWRSVFAALAGAHSAGATSLAIDGLLANEVIPRGDMIRIGDFRHRVLTTATANGSGAATVAISSPVRSALADDTPVRIPGDFFVGSMASRPTLGQADIDGVRTFEIAFNEAYEDEHTDITVSPPVGFVFVVD